MNQIPNPAQAHASLPTTGSAQTLAQLGYTPAAQTDNLLLQVVGGSVRMTANGTNPTASLGIVLNDGDIVEIGSVEMGVVRFITASGTPRLEIVSYIL